MNSQYISNRKLFFVFSHTTGAKFHPKTSLMQQYKSVPTGSKVLGNSAGEWVVTLGSLLIIIPPHLLLIWKYRIFIAQDGAMAAPILLFKRTEAGGKHKQLTCFDKNGLFTSQNVFCDITDNAFQITLGTLNPTGLKIIIVSEPKKICDDYHYFITIIVKKKRIFFNQIPQGCFLPYIILDEAMKKISTIKVL